MRKWLWSFFLATRSFWQAVFWGLFLSVSTLGLYLLLLLRWPYGEMRQADRLVIQLAIGQVFTGFMTIFFTLTLGVFAVREFMERRALPNLQLLFADTADDSDQGYRHLKLSTLSTRFTDSYEVNLQVLNTGSTTAIWYRFEITLPFLEAYLGPSSRFSPGIGKYDEHWTSLRYNQNVYSVVFSSQGELVAYPHWPMSVATVRIPLESAGALPRDYICEYKLVLDGQPIQRGELRITLYPANKV